MTSPYQIDIVRPDELGASERALWTDIVRDDPAYASPYFRPEFAIAAGKVAPHARVAVMHRAGRIAGFLPFQRRGRLLQPIAAPLNDYHGVVARPGEGPGLDEVRGLLGASKAQVAGWVGAETPGPRLVERTCLLAHAPDGWDAYMAERRGEHGKYFKNKDRSRRAFERDCGTPSFRFADRSLELLDRLVELKREQYRRTRRHDVFACGWTRDLLAALLETGEGEFGAGLSVMSWNDEPVALTYGLWAGERYHFWFPTFEPRFGRFGTGGVLTEETIRWGAGRGLRTFDFGFAGESYKKYFCNGAQRVLEGEVEGPGWRAAASRALDALERRPDGALARIRASARRRFAVIDACETTPWA
ncbi:GNAT family N-acetyltransferase, partial [Caulobacter sp. 17J65-9]|uniref:GNAT family N-acetyltransferase n=1 Tax=Caulobacter sp. 17J65-9 TaxID=2709382 RepID=UPI0013C79A8B